MKKILIALFCILVVGFIVWNLEEAPSESPRVLQGIKFCTATTESLCYDVTCTTGTVTEIEVPVPGAVPYTCSDGSAIVMNRL